MKEIRGGIIKTRIKKLKDEQTKSKFRREEGVRKSGLIEKGEEGKGR